MILSPNGRKIIRGQREVCLPSGARRKPWDGEARMNRKVRGIWEWKVCVLNALGRAVGRHQVLGGMAVGCVWKHRPKAVLQHSSSFHQCTEKHNNFHGSKVEPVSKGWQGGWWDSLGYSMAGSVKSCPSPQKQEVTGPPGTLQTNTEWQMKRLEQANRDQLGHRTWRVRNHSYFCLPLVLTLGTPHRQCRLSPLGGKR